MCKTEKWKPYQLFIGTITGTGWPIDGHRLVLGKWDYSPETYSLMDWGEKDDEALMMTLFQTGWKHSKKPGMQELMNGPDHFT